VFIDRGYQGIVRLHPNSCTPEGVGKLDKAERQHNRNLVSLRVVAEHVNRKLKLFGFLLSVIEIDVSASGCGSTHSDHQL